MTAAVSYGRPLADPALVALYKRARVAKIRLARDRAVDFAPLVLRDEKTGKRITMTPMHEEWHRLLDVHKRLIIWSHVEAGKTSQISVGRTLFWLGQDPNARIVILSRTQGTAIKVIRSIQKYITRSQDLRDVFPNLKPSVPWTSTALMVEREAFSKDFSVQACGVGGAIVGARIDKLIIDDILDWTNTRTPGKREELRRWFKSEIVGRLTEDAQVAVVGNAYNPDDMLHELQREGYEARTYPVADTNGVARFPKAWPPERIAAKRKELGPVEAARQLDCVARADSDARCKDEWVLDCLTRGIDIPLYSGISAEQLPPGCICYTGVDLGVKKKKTSGKTVVFTIMVWPNGDRQVVALRSGRFSAVEIKKHVLDAHQAFGSIVLVEDNGAQDLLIQLTQEDASEVREGVGTGAIHIRPFHTGMNKGHPVYGVESVFAEFAMKRWIIPSTQDDETKRPQPASTPIAEWLGECLNYDPDRHTGDHLMASWFAKEGARAAERHDAGGVGVRVLGGGTGDVPDDVVDVEAYKAELEGWEAIMPKRP